RPIVEASWPWRPLERVEADHRAGQHGQGVEALRTSLAADAEPPEATQPGTGPLDGPAVTAKPLRRLDHAAGDPRADTALAQVTSAAAMVVVGSGRSAVPCSRNGPFLR